MAVIKLEHADDESYDGIETWSRAYRSDAALPCPFCGCAPMIVPWHGRTKYQRMIMCRSAYCAVQPSICNKNEKAALADWNQRPDEE